ncbi:MAG TPA: cyclase [Chloroflexi bacterium]|nr:cyclase [Chloroflexota bacterium]
MDLEKELCKLLREIGDGRMMSTAYDTAWVARLSELDEPIGKRALEWLRAHQLEDGSWGASQPYYHHDRAISTLAAINALAQQGEQQDRTRLARAKEALKKALSGLDTDPAGETIGFEMIVPTLLNEARSLGTINHQETRVIEHLTPKRSAKLAALPDGMINRFVTLGFSAEMAGSDGMQILDTQNLQEADGSVSYSPSATAYFALYVHRCDPNALEYLENIAVDGSVPNVAPFDVFEPAWVLWNLKHIPLDDEMMALCQPHLDFLEHNWTPGRGMGFAAHYLPKDGDCTSITYDVLTHFGRSVDLDAVLHYESPYYFRCFDLESTPSISTNTHVLSALREAGLEKGHPAVQKALRFLREARTGHPFWFDKWHASPYYTTGLAINACLGYADDVAREAVQWTISTQNEDGSWGYYDMPTAEETAYCLQALTVWNQSKNNVPPDVLINGALWLREHIDPPYPPLWIGKCLYSPVLVVRSTILSALTLVRQTMT